MDLLLDLLELARVQFAEVPATEGRLAEAFREREVEVRGTLAGVLRVAADRGLVPEPARRIDLAAGLAALEREAGAGFVGAGSPLHGVVFAQAALARVLAGLLGESDAGGWRAVLLPALVDAGRCEGRLRAVLEGLGAPEEASAALLRVLIARVAGGAQERIWSFDLRRMSLRRLLCGGDPRGGGFFPDGMRGFSRS